MTANGPLNFETNLTRAKFQDLTRHLLKRTETPVNNALRDGRLSPNDINEVLLVGAHQVEPIRRGLEQNGFDMNHVHVVDTVKEAFAYVYQNATTEDTILLENDLPDAFSH